MSEFKELYAIVVCADGFKMSVQASRTHYCQPRDDQGPYTHVEIGFPSTPEPLIYDYAEDADKFTETVYPYVSFEIVLSVIEKHGGMVSGELPEQIPPETIRGMVDLGD